MLLSGTPISLTLPPPDNFQVGAEVQAQAEATKEGRQVLLPGFGQACEILAAARRTDPAADLSEVLKSSLFQVSHEGDIEILVVVEQVGDGVLSTLASAGFLPEVNWGDGILKGLANYSVIEELAEISGVMEIAPAVLLTDAGDVTTEGDALLNANALRSVAGVGGAGVKIGVISDGIVHRSVPIASDDLPSNISFTSQGNGDEGTAMLEIVHDIAPEADLYFAPHGGTPSGMTSAIEWMVNQEVDVIVDDVNFGYSSTSAAAQHYFSDGAVADAAAAAVDDSVVYVTSAGNWDRDFDGNAYTGMRTHWQGDFSDDGNGWTVFSGTGDRYAQDVGNFVYVVPDGSIGVNLQWSDEWGESDNDYNLYLLNYDGSGAWAYSEIAQTGSENPWEGLTWTNDTGYLQLVNIAISQYSGDNRELELYVVGNGITALEYTTGDSLCAQKALEEVIAVGAINADDVGLDEVPSYSSNGPTTIYTDFDNQTSVERDALDLCGIALVSTKIGTTQWFSTLFGGTSAACPHIAAIAGLLLEIDSSLTPAEIESFINDNATDLTGYGTDYDDVSGYGRADAEAIISAATGTPGLDEDSDTGVYHDDRLTKLDNSDNDNKLDFTVTGTVSGATVRLYAGDTEIGYAIATGSTTPITTNGTVDLSDDQEPYSVHTITARQTVPDKLPSVASSGLEITVDVVAPTVTAFARYYQAGNWKLRPTTLDTITITFSEDVYDEDSDGLSLYNLSTSQPLSPDYTFDGQETDEFTWDFNADLTSNPGWYSVTISGDVTDLAGNGLDGDDYVYGVDTLQKDMLIPILGDANLDGAVSYTDLQILMANYGQSPRDWQHGDFNYNGVVDASDYITVKQHMGQSVSR